MPDCPACGTETTAATKRCPNCGSAVTTSRALTLADGAVGVAAGVVAFVIGFVATAVTSNAEESREAVKTLLGESGPAGVALSEFLPEWYHALSWEFLENHQVTVSATAGDMFGGGVASGYVDTLLPSASAVQFLPPLLLAGAGLFVTYRGVYNSWFNALLAGMTVTLGYLPCIAAITVVSSFEVAVLGTTLVEIAPDVVRAVLVAGVAYPLVFGGIGGLCAFGLAHWRGD